MCFICLVAMDAQMFASLLLFVFSWVGASDVAIIGE